MAQPMSPLHCCTIFAPHEHALQPPPPLLFVRARRQHIRFDKSRPWDYFINLSGDSYPVLRPEPLRRRLAENGRHLNYMTSKTGITGLVPTAWSEFDPTWHKAKAFPFPLLEGPAFKDTQAHYGSQWMVLTRSFVEFVLREREVPGSLTHELAEWFQHGSLEIDVGKKDKIRVKPHIPDELFFPTVLMNSPRFNGSSAHDGPESATVPPPRLPLMRDMHFIRMDEHYPWSSSLQRYEAPPGYEARSWGPYYVGAYDLHDVKASGALFVRKVSPQVDENVLRLLPVDAHADIPDLAWPQQLPPLTKTTTAPSAAPGTKSAAAPPAPAPAPGSGLPPIRLLASGKPNPVVDENGCVGVAESVHCPPKHKIDPEIVRRYDLPVGVGFGG